ncbi:hypothetical protein PAHAL_3G245700 [Panicum hallii]|uniref:Uncharacterized protein n=1 Tax=Panicum hallii TaxID=206008 RepID=A0A2T8KJ79_9POAL|nr:hypothetical protein PAHAL_3G245700 [Panicum hallii]
MWEDSAKRHPVFQSPAASIIIKGKGTEQERLLLGHLGVAQPPLADPNVAVPPLYPPVLPTLHGLCHAAPGQLHKAEVRLVAERVGGDDAPARIDPPEPAGGQHLAVYIDPPCERERGRQAHQLLPLPCLRQKPPHDEAPPLPIAVLTEHGDSVLVRRPVRAFRLGEDAHLRVPRRLLGAVDVREAEHLAAEGVADEARNVEVQVDGSQLAHLSAAARGDDGGRGAYVHEGEEEEAVAARCFDDTAVEKGHVVAAGVVAGWVGEVGGDDEVGEARGFGEPERRARRPRVCQPRERVDHSPRRARGRRGEAAEEAAGDGGGEAKDAAERHLEEPPPRRCARLL